MPSPLRPSRQTRSPGSICNSTWSSRRGPPKARLTFRKLNNAMNARLEMRAKLSGGLALSAIHPELAAASEQNYQDDRRMANASPY